MLLAAVIILRALEPGQCQLSAWEAGQDFWRARLDLSPGAAGPAANWTGSPLLGLPGSQPGCPLAAGQSAWLRLTTCEASLSRAALESWLPALPPQLELGGLGWQVQAVHTQAGAHPWAGQTSPHALANQRLINIHPPRAWQVHFASPAVFQEYPGRFPLPTAASLFARWLACWYACGPLALPPGLEAALHSGLHLAMDGLSTSPLAGGWLGCLGQAALHARRLPVKIRAALDLLTSLAFYCGSGQPLHGTWGLSQVQPLTESAPRSRAGGWRWWQEGQPETERGETC